MCMTIRDTKHLCYVCNYYDYTMGVVMAWQFEFRPNVVKWLDCIDMINDMLHVIYMMLRMLKVNLNKYFCCKRIPVILFKLFYCVLW